MDMVNTPKRPWCFMHLHCILIGSLVASSSLTSSSSSSTPTPVTSKVGRSAVLPCSWKSRLGDESLPDCHVQWQTPVDTVYEKWGERKWEAPEFRGRVAVPEERLAAGDCSLTVSDLQFGDVGLYESFIVRGGGEVKERVFIQSVRLAVHDHKSSQSRHLGDNMVLELHTHKSVRLVYQGRNSSDWSDVWMRGDQNSERLEKHQEREQLTLKRLQTTDEGTYKVLDEHGLAVSTVQLTVNGSKTQILPRFQDRLAGDAADNRCSSLLVAFGLAIAPLALHLLQ
ncbi:galectin 17 isoform 2-T2 [Polymixia lowei]